MARPRRAMSPGKMPLPLAAFVDREAEVAELAPLVGSARLVTLIGPGGIGKTRLAVRVAERVARAFPDGAWFIDLATLRDPALLAEHVAAELGLSDESGTWIPAMLAEHLSGRRLLLILDNCEHVVDAAAVVAGTLLRRAPDLTILATSRQRLGITGEIAVDVQPLAPEAAVLLLHERAERLGSGIGLGDAKAATAVCERLEGIPLAIELAAARLRSVPVQELLRRLDDRFAVLVSGDPSGPDRQVTLRAAVDWSHGLLSSPERIMWRRSSVFVGGFDDDAMRAVCLDGELDADSAEHALTGLVERSIVRLEDGGRGRYRMLETLREYGEGRSIDAGELDHLRDLHRDHFLGVGEAATATFAGGGQLAAFARLSAEHDNIRAALERCRTDAEAAERGLRAAAGLWLWWQHAGRLGEGRRWIDVLLEAVPARSAARPVGLWGAGYLALVQGDLDVAEATLRTALARSRKTGDRSTEAYAVGHLGLLALFRGDFDKAEVVLTRSVELHREQKRPGVAAFQLADAALAATFAGRPAVAIDRFAESIAESRALSDSWTTSHALWGLGIADWMLGNLQDAEAAHREALVLMREVGDRSGLAMCFEGLTLVAAARGDRRRAAQLAASADAAWAAVPRAAPPPMQALRGRAFAAARIDRIASVVGKDLDVLISHALGEEPRRAEARSARSSQPTLSARELEVAALIADGLTNRQIADRLVLSPRTVESHVARMMSRLGVDSRAQIAAWVATHAPDTAAVQMQ